MFEILPGILEKEWEPIERKIELVLPFAKAVHVDILDGKFAPNTTFLDPKPFAKYADKVLLELHMMVEEPINYLDSWAAAGFRRFLGHIEHMSDQAAFVAKAEQLGEVGLAIDGPTPISQVKVPYQDLDCVLVMTIKAGFSGQSFVTAHLEKVRRIKQDASFLTVSIDGGVNDQIVEMAVRAGVTRFTATSFIFKTGDPKAQYEMLQKKLQSFYPESERA